MGSVWLVRVQARKGGSPACEARAPSFMWVRVKIKPPGIGPQALVHSAISRLPVIFDNHSHVGLPSPPPPPHVPCVVRFGEPSEPREMSGLRQAPGGAAGDQREAGADVRRGGDLRHEPKTCFFCWSVGSECGNERFWDSLEGNRKPQWFMGVIPTVPLGAGVGGAVSFFNITFWADVVGVESLMWFGVKGRGKLERGTRESVKGTRGNSWEGVH